MPLCIYSDIFLSNFECHWPIIIAPSIIAYVAVDRSSLVILSLWTAYVLTKAIIVRFPFRATVDWV